MAKKRGTLLTELPAVIHPEMRLTAEQVMRLTGRGRTRFYADLKRGLLPQPERDGRAFVRWRAASVFEALEAIRRTAQ